MTQKKIDQGSEQHFEERWCDDVPRHFSDSRLNARDKTKLEDEEEEEEKEKMNKYKGSEE